MTILETTFASRRHFVVGVPGYWHESEMILGREATALPNSYIRALSKVGLLPLIIPAIPQQAMRDRYLDMIGGLLLVGGPDLAPAHYGQDPAAGLRRVTPARDEVELAVTRRALDAGLPILAICRGLQVLNVAVGGTLWQDIVSQRPRADKHDFHPDYPEGHLAHPVTVVSESRLAAILGADEIWVNSLHHQAVDRLGQGLRATAHAPDGTIEAVEATDRRWILGVQWHPEWLVDHDPRMLALFDAFRQACAG